jgi:2-keto-4-pentenoate hydratase/2-oxohepta-3-ene-1,7-dioic acid hydratase in catechol pathway
MKLVRFTAKGRTGFGGYKDGGIVDLGARMSDVSGPRELIARGLIARAEDLVAKFAPDLGDGDFKYELPVDAPDKILCVGVNYPERHDEYTGDGYKPPAPYPSLFLRTPGSFAPHRSPIYLPPESAQLDYEGEIALVIGREGRRIAPDQAMSHVAGLTIANEGTIRDWLKHSNRQITPGKNFDCSGSLGPWIDTDAQHQKSMSLTTHVNEELRQTDVTDRLIYPFDRLISYISTFTRIYPGDVILTGTPTGAGARFDPPRFLKAGDVLKIEVSGVGVLLNQIVAEGCE